MLGVQLQDGGLEDSWGIPALGITGVDTIQILRAAGGERTQGNSVSPCEEALVPNVPRGRRARRFTLAHGKCV